MNCLDSLDISAGVTSVAGSGGKSTLLRILSEEIVTRRCGTVILATTTHFMPFEGVPLVTSANEAELASALRQHQVICVGRPVGNRPAGDRRACGSGRASAQHPIPCDMDKEVNARPHGNATPPPNSNAPYKLGPSPIALERLAQLADYVIVEADGSKRLPLKAHASHEPVIPPCSTQTLLVVGAKGFGKNVCDAVHRPEIFCERAGCKASDAASPSLVARCIAVEIGLGVIHPNRIVVNQAETPGQWQEADEFMATLHHLGIESPVLAGRIRNHELKEIAQ